jgi:hypothetical protein
MYYSYMLYQAGRTRTPRQQREEDIRAGELAAEFARPRRRLKRGITRRQATRPGTMGSRATGPADARPSHAPAACTAQMSGARRPDTPATAQCLPVR